MTTSNTRALLAAGFALLIAAPGLADDVTRKITTVVAGNLPEGASKIDKQVVEECIASLPKESDLAPVVDAKSKYLRSINGDDSVNGSVRTYSATVVVPYLVRQKQLVIVTSASVEKSEPVLQEVIGRFDRSITFTSNPENGDHFGGRDLVKEYYFSNEAAAIEDAMRRARAWLKQQRSVMCNN